MIGQPPATTTSHVYSQSVQDNSGQDFVLLQLTVDVGKVLKDHNTPPVPIKWPSLSSTDSFSACRCGNLTPSVEPRLHVQAEER